MNTLSICLNQKPIYIKKMNKSYKIKQYIRSKDGQKIINQKLSDLFSLLKQREMEICFNPNIYVDYPDENRFLSSTIEYIDDKIAEKCDISQVVILTTYGDKLFDTLCGNGFKYEKIDMPAAPTYTCLFKKRISKEDEKILYIEFVDEQDEKILPSVVFTIESSEGEFMGGVCGSIFRDNGSTYAYLSTMAIAEGVQKGTGSDLLSAVLSYWKNEGVEVVNLGTQTAEGFYLKNGFTTIKRVLPNLRYKKDNNDAIISIDLVMMQINI